MKHDRNLPRAAEVERLLFHWPAVVRAAGDDWAKGFSMSIARQSRRRGWRPTEKQMEIMRRLVADLFTHAHEGGEHPLIED